MAWNEPGGNSNNQDPWGGKRPNNGDRKGPPDLDEAFRKLQESLNGLFGGGKKRGGDDGGARQGQLRVEVLEFGQGVVEIRSGTGHVVHPDADRDEVGLHGQGQIVQFRFRSADFGENLLQGGQMRDFSVPVFLPGGNVTGFQQAADHQLVKIVRSDGAVKVCNENAGLGHAFLPAARVDKGQRHLEQITFGKR